jgi:hypothetical protein
MMCGGVTAQSLRLLPVSGCALSAGESGEKIKRQ